MPAYFVCHRAFNGTSNSLALNLRMFPQLGFTGTVDQNSLDMAIQKWLLHPSSLMREQRLASESKAAGQPIARGLRER
jgi:hypothetical protein